MCKICSTSFIWKNKGSRRNQREKIFKQWIIGKDTISELSKKYKRSNSSIQRLCYEFLAKPPIPQIKENINCHLIINGTYISDFCVINYLDADLKHLQYFEIVKTEDYRDFKLSLELLLRVGLNIVSVTSDGHKDLISAVRDVLPGVKHQRCIVHVQRMALNYLTRFPKSEAGRELRVIARDLHKITDREEKNKWIFRFDQWNYDHREYINDRRRSLDSNYLYAHPEIRKARSVIKNSLPNLFYYLDDPKIPKSTNGLECRFSYLKNNLRIHRGLSNKNRRNFVLWYSWFKYN